PPAPQPRRDWGCSRAPRPDSRRQADRRQLPPLAGRRLVHRRRHLPAPPADHPLRPPRPEGHHREPQSGRDAMSEPAPHTPSTPAAGPPADPRRLAAVLVQRVGRAPLVLGGTVLLLALWTGAFLLSERKQTRGPAQPTVPPPSAEQSPGTRELIQRFLEESRRQAAQEAAAQADRYPQQDTGEFSGFPPAPSRPQQPEMPAPEWEPREEPRQADRRSDPAPR